jgi:hypothetical protein
MMCLEATSLSTLLDKVLPQPTSRGFTAWLSHRAVDHIVNHETYFETYRPQTAMSQRLVTLMTL